MPKTPQPNRDLSLTGPNFVPFQNRPVDTYTGYTVLSKGLSDLAKGTLSAMNSIDEKKRYDHAKAEAQANAINAVKAKREREDRVFEASKLTSQIHKDWLYRVKDYEKAPSEDLLPQFEEEYKKYSTDLLKGIDDKTLHREMELQLLQLQNSTTQDVFRLETATRQANFAASFDQIVANGEDAIYAKKDIDTLAYQQSLIENTVEQALGSGRIRDEATAQKLLDRAGQLSVSWAYANMPSDPQMVLDMLDNKSVKQFSPSAGEVVELPNVFKGITARQREVVRSAAKTSLRAKDTFDRASLVKAHNTNLENVIAFGKETSDNYLDQVEALNGPEARKALTIEIAHAYQKHTVKEEVKGATLEQIANSRNRNRPKEGASDEAFQTYRTLQPIYQAAESEHQEDPFAHFMQHPSIQALLIDNDGDSLAPEVAEKVIELQKNDVTIAPFEVAVMSNAQADKFIDTFNQAVAVSQDSGSVFAALQGLHAAHPEHMNLASAQIARRGKSTTVGKLVNPLMWHFDNPTAFQLIVDAVRKDNAAEMQKLGKEKDIKSFKYNVQNDGQFLAYRQSIDAYDNSPDAANATSGVLEAFQAFARDQVVAGGSVAAASNIFFDRYKFTNFNGVPLTIPSRWTNPETGEAGTTHLTTDAQQYSFNRALEVFALETLENEADPRSVIPVTDFMDSSEISEDMAEQYPNVYYVVGPDETELLMYVRGSMLGSARQLTNKEGTPITVPIADMLSKDYDAFFDNPRAIFY